MSNGFPKTFRYAHRSASGTIRYKNLWAVTFGYTETQKKVLGSDTDAVLASNVITQAGETITSGITNPDVPRGLTVTTGGTAGDIATGTVVITGTNVEGKVISETFNTTANTAETLTGSKVFKTVTSIVVSAQDGAAAEVSVGFSNRIGVNHRLYPNNTTVKVIQDTSVATPAPAYQAAPTVVADAEEIENNYVVPATAPDGTTFLTIAYVYDQFSTFPTHDEPNYSTSTSTSSTSTSTSSSTSSTSTSTSSTSVSTSSTSSSTSSTSTSTTTAP